MKNPFKGARSIKELGKLMRKEYEALRGQRVRYWSVEQGWLDGKAEELVLTIDAGDTHGTDRWWGVSWLDVLEGRRDHEFKPGSKLAKWQGFGIFGGGSGGSGRQKNCHRYTVRISLKYLPLIRKAWLHNMKYARDLHTAKTTDAQTVELNRQIADLEERLRRRQQAVEKAFHIKRRKIDIQTGKEIRHAD